MGFFDSEPQSFLLRALLNSVKLKDDTISKRLFQSNYGIKCIKSRSTFCCIIAPLICVRARPH